MDRKGGPDRNHRAASTQQSLIPGTGPRSQTRHAQDYANTPSASEYSHGPEFQRLFAIS